MEERRLIEIEGVSVADPDPAPTVVTDVHAPVAGGVVIIVAVVVAVIIRAAEEESGPMMETEVMAAEVTTTEMAATMRRRRLRRAESQRCRERQAKCCFADHVQISTISEALSTAIRLTRGVTSGNDDCGVRRCAIRQRTQMTNDSNPDPDVSFRSGDLCYGCETAELPRFLDGE